METGPATHTAATVVVRLVEVGCDYLFPRACLRETEGSGKSADAAREMPEDQLERQRSDTSKWHDTALPERAVTFHG